MGDIPKLIVTNAPFLGSIALEIAVTAGAFWWFYINSIKPAIADLKARVDAIDTPFFELSGYLKGADYDKAITELKQETKTHGELLSAIHAHNLSVDNQLLTLFTSFSTLTKTVEVVSDAVTRLKALEDAVKSRIQEAIGQLEGQLGSLRSDLMNSIAAGDLVAQHIAAKATVDTLKVRLTLSRIPTGAGDPNIERELDKAELLLRDLEKKISCLNGATQRMEIVGKDT